jgi:acetate CoA/acetoacetate CoA-transferase beta subunit
MEVPQMKERLDREVIAMRAAKELKEGDCVNLGIGIPNLCAHYIPEGVLFQTENGALGYGALIREDEIEDVDHHYVDAGGKYWRSAPGMALFDLVTSFAMIRSGRMTTILGGLQVSATGDLANWNTGSGALGGTIGGGMDLAVGAKKVIVALEHVDKNGKPKIVNECTYPLTAKACVNTIITDVAVIDITKAGLVLREAAPGWTAEDVRSVTEPELIIAEGFKEIDLE